MLIIIAFLHHCQVLSALLLLSLILCARVGLKSRGIVYVENLCYVENLAEITSLLEPLENVLLKMALRSVWEMVQAKKEQVAGESPVSRLSLSLSLLCVCVWKMVQL